MTSYKTQTSQDGTTKIVFDEGYIAVIIPTKDDKLSVCVSCQIGCPVGCRFCFSGKTKFKRNLSAGEIVNQIKVAEEFSGKTPTSIVFMGMGEPTLNLNNVLEAGEKIHRDFNISYNRITISTSCLKTLDKLIDTKFNIALSLHSPFDNVRKKLIPLGISVSKIVKFSKDYLAKGNNKKYIMIEYSLIKGVNDSEKDLKKLISLKWPKKMLFNLIEFNELDSFQKSDREKTEYFKEEIIKKGWKCFIRGSRGKDIEASCGMLNA